MDVRAWLPPLTMARCFKPASLQQLRRLIARFDSRVFPCAGHPRARHHPQNPELEVGLSEALCAGLRRCHKRRSSTMGFRLLGEPQALTDSAVVAEPSDLPPATPVALGRATGRRGAVHDLLGRQVPQKAGS